MHSFITNTTSLVNQLVTSQSSPRHCFEPQNRDLSEIMRDQFSRLRAFAAATRSQRQRARSGNALAAQRCAPTVTHGMHGTQHAPDPNTTSLVNQLVTSQSDNRRASLLTRISDDSSVA